MAKYNYITFDQLMASVESDFNSYADAGLMNRGVAIKAVRKVNEDLGLKLNKEKEAIIEIKNYKGDLPEDFMYLQLALACTVQHYNLGPGTVFGTHTVEHNLPKEETTITEVPVNVYQNSNPWGQCQLNECNGTYWVTQIYKEKQIKFNQLIPLKLTPKSLKYCSDSCLNQKVQRAAYDIDIENGQIVTGFREGKIYINYLADMVDEENNVLILDHPLLTDYYEYSVKKRFLENFFMNGDVDAVSRLQYVNNELRDSRLRALNFINTIEYTDIQDTYKINRSRFYKRYIGIIDNPTKNYFHY